MVHLIFTTGPKTATAVMEIFPILSIVAILKFILMIMIHILVYFGVFR